MVLNRVQYDNIGLPLKEAIYKRREAPVGQLIQLAGSILLLTPFVLAQMGRLTTGTVTYALMNAVGSTILAINAAFGQQWGFLLMEAVWAAVSLTALARFAMRSIQQDRPSAADQDRWLKETVANRTDE